MFDHKIIKKYYDVLENKILRIKNIIQRPLTLSEKILYLHQKMVVKIGISLKNLLCQGLKVEQE